MSKLKLKSKKHLLSTGKKSDKLKDVDSKSGQSQPKLSQFFDNNSETTTEIKESKTHFKQTLNNENATTSKYFTITKSEVVESDSNEDESFADFQPEKVKKPSKVLVDKKKEKIKDTKKTKSARKCKDKSDNLTRYTAEFEKVCTAGGIDVNPEHLQLAIAMSLSMSDNRECKSVHIDKDEPICSTSGESSHSYNEDDKVKRIRKTLLEYGFKVPLGPICTNPIVKRKRPAKYDKSLLLTKTADEKKQILSNAVSRIMFEDQSNILNVCEKNESNTVSELHSSVLDDIWCRNCSIVSKNSLTFKDMSDEYDIFYIRNLITPTDVKVGCLLKDWSKIPGRDPSPERIKQCLDFRENVLYVEEFDSMLSSCFSYIENRIQSIIHKSPSPKKCVGSVESRLRLTVNEEFKTKSEIVVIKSRSCSPELFGENSYYGEGFGEPNENIELLTEIRSKKPVRINESSNDSLPDVFVSQMSQPRNTLKFPAVSSGNLLSTVNEEVICVEEYGVTSLTNTSKNLSDCSIDLTQTGFGFDSKICGKEPLFVDETESEDSLENSQELLKNVNDSRNETLANNVNKQDTNINCKSCANTDVSVETDESNVIVKRKIASLGSIEDTIRFEAALKEYNFPNPVTESTSSINESIDLTDEGDDLFELSSSQRFSQMYKNDNGVLHFESYHDEIVDVPDRSSPEQNYVTLRNKNVHNLSVSLVDDENCANVVDSPKPNEIVNQCLENVSADIFGEDDISFRNESVCKVKYGRKSRNHKNIHNLSDSVLSDKSNNENEDVQKYGAKNDKNHNLSESMIGKDSSVQETSMINEQTDHLKEDNRFIDLIKDKCIENCDKSEKEIDLTQLSNGSDKKLDDSNFIDDPHIFNPYVENASPKKSLNNSDEVFVISDEEFNYSINASVKRTSTSKSKRNKINHNAISESESDLDASDERKSVDYNDYKVPNDFDLYGSSIFDQIPSYHASRISGMSARKSSESKKSVAVSNSTFNELPDVVLPGYSYRKEILASNVKDNKINRVSISTTTAKRLESMSNMENINTRMVETETASCSKESPVPKLSDFVNNLANNDDTPKSDKFIIKVDNVTPAQDYKVMNTPQVHNELSKYGLKPLKRKRAVQILEHIYNQTHPVVESKDLEAKIKKRKLLKSFQNTSSPIHKNIQESSPDNIATSTEKENHHSNENLPETNRLNLAQASNDENVLMPAVESSGTSVENIYKVDRLSVAVRQMDCDREELYFQTRVKSKILGCRIPLHIAFHNYLSLRSRLQQAILTYHPVNIDTIHKGLVADGYRYNPKDLFQFMDKKCITIKTTDKTGGSRQKKR